MLPLLKENIEKTELAYFIDYFFPIAKKLKTKADHFKNCKKLIESKIFENLQNQVKRNFF
jgi:ribosomal RNA-processing protein 12